MGPVHITAGFLASFPTVIFQTSTLAIIHVYMYGDTGQRCVSEAWWFSYTPPSRALWEPCQDGMQMHRT